MVCDRWVMPCLAVLALALILALGWAGPGQRAAAAESPSVPPPWPPEAANPEPAPGDYTLPMPCGGSMVFRRIDTFVGPGWMADQRIRMGSTDPLFAASEDLRFERLVGGFSDQGDPQRRFYYIGKYEVTVGQFATLMGEGCRPSKADDTVPKDGITWFEGLEFGQRYSQWLLTNARDRLPTEDKVPGFVRLPTEAEWEYAARGGSLIQPSQELARLFPMEGPVTDYAWIAGQQSCNGQTQYIGTHKPNPVGLHDVLGNVAEMTIDLYRGTAPQRLHGQPGGFVVRGGSCLTPERLVRVSDRHEEPLHDPATGQARRAPFVGLRLVIGAPVNTSVAKTEQLQRSAAELRSAQAPPQAAASGDPVAALRKLAADADRPADAERLSRLASDIAAELDRKREAEADGARMAVMSGAVLMRGYRFEMDEVTRRQRAFPNLPESMRPSAQAALDDWKQRADRSAKAYLSLLVSATDTYGPALLRSQMPRVSDALRHESATKLIEMAGRFVAQCDRYGARRITDINELLAEALLPL